MGLSIHKYVLNRTPGDLRVHLSLGSINLGNLLQVQIIIKASSAKTKSWGYGPSVMVFQLYLNK